MNAADWFRKNLKVRLQMRLSRPGKLPAVRKLLLKALDTLTRPHKEG